MTYAAITGWGKCMPPAVLTNADLSTFLDTTDEWIRTRTGISERRIFRDGPTSEMAVRAARIALEHLESQPVLQLGDLPADGAMGDVELFGGRRKASGSRRGIEGAQRFERYHRL